VLAGRHDPESPVPASEELYNGIPDAQLVIFENSGHFPFIEEEMLFSETLDRFLTSEKRD